MSLWDRCKPEARKWASFHLQGNRLKQPRALQMNFQKTPTTQRFQMQRCPQPQSSWEAGWTESLKALCGMGFSYSQGGVISSLFATGFAPVLVCLQGSCPNAIQDQAAEHRGPSQAGMIHRRGTRQGLEDCVLQPGGKDAQATASCFLVIASPAHGKPTDTVTLQADFITQPVTKQKGSLRAEMGTLLSILYPAQALALVETSPGREGVSGKPRPAL